MKADLSCGERCKWPAVVILVLIGLIYFAAVAMVVRFYVRFSNEVYKPAEAASSPADVQDPFLRFLQSRLRDTRNLFAHVATRQRTRGSFQPGKEATEEPARTERLLSRPLALLRARDSDALDQLQPLLGDGRGNRLAYVSYNILTLTVNITLGIIAGAVTDKTDVARATIAIKISFAAWLILLSPMKDRLTCWVNAIQFLLEGIAASIALSETASAAASAHCAASSQAGPAFYTGIAAVLVPILLLLYDSLFVKVYLISKGTKKVTLGRAVVHHHLWHFPQVGQGGEGPPVAPTTPPRNPSPHDILPGPCPHGDLPRPVQHSHVQSKPLWRPVTQVLVVMGAEPLWPKRLDRIMNTSKQLAGTGVVVHADKRLKTFTKKSVTPRLAFAFRRRRSGEQSGTVSDVPENDSGEIERTPRAASPESSTEICLRL